MTDELKNLSLSTLCEGAAEIVFQEALSQVLENMTDINADPKAERSITITVKFKPELDREGRVIGATVIVEDAKIKLGKKNPVLSKIMIGVVNGEVQAKEYRQMNLFDEPITDKLRSIK